MIHGQLSPILLPPELLKQAIYSIHSELMHQVSTDVNILHSNVVGDHYRSHRFVVARQGSKLLVIALTFPLTSNQYDYTLYQLQSFPVPVPGEHNAAHVTEITNLPYGVAFRSPHAHHEYLVFSTKPDLIDNFFLYTHQQSEPLRIFSTHHTCVSALLQNNRSLINQLCQFHFRPEYLQPNIIPLTSSTVLVTNMSSLTYDCYRRRKTVHDCLQCQMTIPCGCSLKTPFGIIPRRFSGCIHVEDNVTTYHTVNLAVLQSFFDDNTLGSLVGSTLLHQPLPVDIPAFRTLKTDALSHLARDSELRYDLNRAVNITKANDKAFHSLTDSLWRDVLNLDNIGSQYSFSIGLVVHH